MHARLTWMLLIMVGVCASAGCRGLARPAWLNPGPTQYQRYNAIVHDPYPDTHTGPEALGTRPRDYDDPKLSESEAAIVRHVMGPWRYE